MLVFFFSSLSPPAPPLSPAFCASWPRVPLALALFVFFSFFVFLSCVSCPLVLCAPVLAGCGVLLFPASGALGPLPPRPPVPFVCVVPCVACCCGFTCCVSCCGCPPGVVVGCFALCGVSSGGFLWVVLRCAGPSVAAVCSATALVPLSRCVVRVVACCLALVCVPACCAVVSLCRVPLLPVSWPRAWSGALGCYALLRCVFPCLSALGAPRGVFCGGVLARAVARRLCFVLCVSWDVVLCLPCPLPAVRCCAALWWSAALASCVRLVCAVSGTRCSGAFLCAVLFPVVLCALALRCASGCVVCRAAARCAVFSCVLSCCVAALLVRCCVVLCWRACVVLLCCALLRLLCSAASCGAACGFCWFAGGPRCPLWCPDALRRWCPVVPGVFSWCPAPLRSVLRCCSSVWSCVVVPCGLFLCAVCICLLWPVLKTTAKPGFLQTFLLVFSCCLSLFELK